MFKHSPFLIVLLLLIQGSWCQAQDLTDLELPAEKNAVQTATEHLTVYETEAVEIDPALSVYISPGGPLALGWKETVTLTANASGGCGSYSYEWFRSINGGSWQSVGTSQSYYYVSSWTTEVQMKVVVTDCCPNSASDIVIIWGEYPDPF